MSVDLGAFYVYNRDQIKEVCYGCDSSQYITPAIKYLNIVIPAKAGIQEGTGCQIKSGMTELDYLVARLISLDQDLAELAKVFAARSTAQTN